MVLICSSCTSILTQFRVIQPRRLCYPHWVGPDCIKLTINEKHHSYDTNEGSKEAKISQSKPGCRPTWSWSGSPDYRNLVYIDVASSENSSLTLPTFSRIDVSRIIVNLLPQCLDSLQWCPQTCFGLPWPPAFPLSLSSL